jgi:Zn-dependent protease
MDIPSIIISIFVILFAITIHEASHGWAAYKLGDPTAHVQGRITLNPIAHIDPFGTILLPAMLIIMGSPPFGYAKPVPVNPYNLRDPKRDNMLISAAGPLSNLAVAFVAFIGFKMLSSINPEFLARNANLVTPLFQILYYTVLLNVILAIFNMIPIPPLDGSGILMGFLSDEANQKYDRIRPYGFFILVLLIFTGIIGRIIGFVVAIVNFFL